MSDLRRSASIVELCASTASKSLMTSLQRLALAVETRAANYRSLGPSVPQNRGNQSIYLHRSGPLLENGLDRPENCYGRYGFASFLLHFHIYRRGGWSESLPLKILFSCSLGGGGRYFSVPSLRCLESQFAGRNDSNRHRFTAISNRTI